MPRHFTATTIVLTTVVFQSTTADRERAEHPLGMQVNQALYTPISDILTSSRRQLSVDIQLTVQITVQKMITLDYQIYIVEIAAFINHGFIYIQARRNRSGWLLPDQLLNLFAYFNLKKNVNFLNQK